MSNPSNAIIVTPRTKDGRQFRPSDWIERLSTIAAAFGRDHRLRYDLDVVPVYVDGEKCLKVSEGFKLRNPQAFSQILAFIESNNLACRS